MDTIDEMNKTDRADEIDQLKSDLLNTMSHELRGPLTSIKGYTTTLLRFDKRLRREEQREFLEAIRDATDTLSAIVDHLLEMAQFEAGTIQLSFAPVDFYHLVQEAIDTAERSRHYTLATGARPNFFTFHLQVRDEHGLPAQPEFLPLVWGDQRRLREALDTILDNALKFSPDGGDILVTLRPTSVLLPEPSENHHNGSSLHSSSVEQPVLEISIQDQGIGIASDHLLRIFDRFQRVDTRLTREVNGLGLGLTLCKHIVALHHGRLWTESQPGKGSTFFIQLPLVPLASATTIDL